jgi:hypothetical protein
VLSHLASSKEDVDANIANIAIICQILNGKKSAVLLDNKSGKYEQLAKVLNMMTWIVV